MPTSASDHEGLAAMGIALPPQIARNPSKHIKQLFPDTGQQAEQGCYPWGKRNKWDESDHCLHCCLEGALKTQSRTWNPSKTHGLNELRTESRVPGSQFAGPEFAEWMPKWKKLQTDVQRYAERFPPIFDQWGGRAMGETWWNGCRGGGGTAKSWRLSSSGSHEGLFISGVANHKVCT